MSNSFHRRELSRSQKIRYRFPEKEPPPPNSELRTASFSAENFFGRKFFGRKIFRPHVAATTVDAEVVFFLIISKNLPLKGKFFEMIKKKEDFEKYVLK